jgi:hypothetical protein
MRRALRIGIVGPETGFSERAARLCRTLSGVWVEVETASEPVDAPRLLERGDLALLILSGSEESVEPLRDHVERLGSSTPVTSLPADLGLLELALQQEDQTGGASGDQRELTRLRRREALQGGRSSSSPGPPGTLNRQPQGGDSPRSCRGRTRTSSPTTACLRPRHSGGTASCPDRAHRPRLTPVRRNPEPRPQADPRAQADP